MMRATSETLTGPRLEVSTDVQRAGDFDVSLSARQVLWLIHVLANALRENQHQTVRLTLMRAT